MTIEDIKQESVVDEVTVETSATEAEISQETADAEIEIIIPDLKYKLEGILFAAQKALSAKQLRALFPEDELPSMQQIQTALEELQQDYAERGVRLEQIASGYCFRATALIAPYVGELIGEKPARYSRALLETLAIIAYRQPITRGEIEQIRGVAVSGHILKTLQEREWIKSVGHKEVPGKPELLATTKTFLDYFHLKALAELPELSQLIEQDPLAAEKALEDQLALAAEPALVENTESDMDVEQAADPEQIVDAEHAADRNAASSEEPL